MATNKFLYRPVHPFHINQRFGENLSLVEISTGKVVSGDGTNPPAGFKSLYGAKGHLGLDLMSYHSQPVYAAAEGIVDFIDTQPKSGLDVRVITTINGEKYKHIYEHLLGYQPKVGQQVEVGDLIGWADNTGWSSGDHLHFQLEHLEGKRWIPIDPLPFMYPAYALSAAPVVKKLKETLANLLDALTEQLRKKKLSTF